MYARALLAAIVLSALFAAPAGAEPRPKDTPVAAATPGAAEHPRDGGIIAGKITSIDYRRNLLTVNKTDILVMPSTQIQGSDPGYHAITDLKPGMSVEVYTSQIAGKYTAQIITLH